MILDRRAVLAGGLALASAGPALAAQVDEDTRTWLRLVSDLSGNPTYALEQGAVWGFKPQADDLTTAEFGKRLYGYVSLVARKAEADRDGVALTTKAWTFYTHPDTGAIVDEVLNPYTGKVVKCPPLSGLALTARYGAGRPNGPFDLRRRRIGDRAWVSVSRISRFKPADTTWFKLEADLFDYACRAADVDNAAAPFIPSTWSHNVVAEWQTWMHMHGEPGHILFKGDGAFIESLDAAPAEVLSAIGRYFPNTLDSVKAWRR